MTTASELAAQTIADFGEQWARYPTHEGYFASVELFEDIVSPLLCRSELNGALVAEIGSGAGRIVGMLLDSGAKQVYAIEPAPCQSLADNVNGMARGRDVSIINCRGDVWTVPELLDFVIAIGVIDHIPEPTPVLKRAYDSLRPGGRMLIWVYGREGNELYLNLVEPLRKITKRLPHLCLTMVVELMYAALVCYRALSRFFRLPLRSYIENVLWHFSPSHRRLVIYDQLKPAYAKYYRKEEAIQLLLDAGFVNVLAYHRHGYSWTIIGTKPLTV